MKNTKTCPKCRGKRLWRIEKIGAKDQSIQQGGVYRLRVAAERWTPPVGEPKKSFWGSDDGSKLYSAGFIEAWVCAACGFTELWSTELEGLVPNPESGVHLVEG